MENILLEQPKLSLVDGFGVDDLAFLDLSGRKTFYQQGIDGKDMVAAIVDTGVTPNDELGDRLLKGINTNSSYRDSSNTVDDYNHGTHVACSVAGKNVGIAKNACILPVKVINGGGYCDNMMDVVDGLNWAIDWKDSKGRQVNVINMSLSATKSGWGDAYEPLHEAIKRANEKGIIVICSAGNTGSTSTRYPACFDEVVTVGAVDVDKQQAYFSTYGNQVDLCQIGVDVISVSKNKEYVKMSGTSMSTPLVSGIALLVIQKYKEIYEELPSEYKIYDMLKMYTKDIGIEGTDKYHGAGFCTLQPMDVKLEINCANNTAKLNGEDIALEDDTLLLSNERYYLSIRRMAELLGLFIEWDAETSTATLEG